MAEAPMFLSRMNLASEWKHGLEDWTGNMTRKIMAAAFGGAGSSAGEASISLQ